MEVSRKVDFRTGKQFAEASNMDFIETSAKTNANVNEAFTLIAKQILQRMEGKGTSKVSKASNSIDPGKKRTADESGGKCAC